MNTTPLTTNSKITQSINIINAVLVGLLAIGSFVLSYASLRQVALTNGVSYYLSYVWPLLIDGALVIFSLSVVSAYLRSESTWRQWALVAIYTAATIAFNILHAPNTLTAQVVAAIAPISLFFSFELLIRQFKNQTVRQSKMLSIQELSALLESLQLEFNKLTVSVNALNTEVDTKSKQLDTLTLQSKERSLQFEQLNLQIEEKQTLHQKLNKAIETAKTMLNDGQIDTGKQKNVNLDPKNKEDRYKLILQAYTKDVNTAVTALVKLTGVSRQTVYNDIRDLETKGLITKNGNTVIVNTKLNGGVK